jgi:hypothetical protein
VTTYVSSAKRARLYGHLVTEAGRGQVRASPNLMEVR